MRQHPTLLTLIGIICLISGLLLSACNVKIEAAACDHFTLSFDNGGDPRANGPVTFTALVGSTPIGTANGVVSGTRATVTIPFNQTVPDGTVITVVAGPGVVATGACNSSTPPKVTWFDPGDLRVDGWAGDRLAVYCPNDKTIGVIGIGANGNGAGVAVFNVAQVIQAGKPGWSAPLRSFVDPKVDLGVVSIQIMPGDGVTSIYIAWNGGILNATGQGDFKKQFVTPIRFCPYTFR